MNRPFRVLIVKLAAIGDVVMALPILTSIRKKHPDALITWICGRQVEPLLKATECIDHILPVDERHLFKGSFFIKCKTLFTLWKHLLGRRYDLVLTLNPDPRYRLLSLPVLAKKRRFFGKNKNRFYPIPGRLHSQEYLNLLEEEEGPISHEVEFPSLHFDPKNVSKRELPFITLAPGGAKNVLAEDTLRRWPITHYRELITLFLKNLPFKIVVIGGSEDVWTLPYLEDLPLENLMGKISLLESIALLKQTHLLVTHDSGPLHLGKLAKCPILALFGPTNPSEKITPSDTTKVLWGGADLACRPCYNGKTYARCKNNLCLSNLTPESVYKEALDMLPSLHRC